MSRLNELAPSVEIVIVPNQLPAESGSFRLSRLLRRERLSPLDLVRTALILAGCTGVGFLFGAVGLAITNVVLIYILGVMAVALLTTGYLYTLRTRVRWGSTRMRDEDRPKLEVLTLWRKKQ